MNFSGLPRLLLRHWYVTLAGITVTIVLCALTTSYVPAKQQAKADVLLLPAAKSVGTGGNPYLELGGLDQAADVLAKSLNDASTADGLNQAGISGTFTVVRDPTTSSPMLLVTATDRTPAGALATLRAVTARAEPIMQKIQADISVPTAYQIITKTLTADQQAHPVRKSEVRAVIAVGALGLLLTALGIAALAAFVDRRALRRAREQVKQDTTIRKRARQATPVDISDAVAAITGGERATRDG